MRARAVFRIRNATEPDGREERFKEREGKLPRGRTAACLAWGLIAQLPPGPTPCRAATMEDKMARGIDLTLQMSFLPGAERTIYVPRFRFC